MSGRDKTDAKERATSFIDKLYAMYGEHRMKQVSRAWCLASSDERKLRLRTTMALSVELDRVKQVNIFATRFAEGAIEAVIEGDWKHVEEYVTYFSFKEDPAVEERIVKLWTPFVIALRAACAEEKSVTRIDLGNVPS